MRSVRREPHCSAISLNACRAYRWIDSEGCTYRCLFLIFDEKEILPTLSYHWLFNNLTGKSDTIYSCLIEDRDSNSRDLHVSWSASVFDDTIFLRMGTEQTKLWKISAESRKRTSSMNMLGFYTVRQGPLSNCISKLVHRRTYWL